MSAQQASVVAPAFSVAHCRPQPELLRVRRALLAASSFMEFMSMTPVVISAVDATSTAHALIERHLLNARQTLQFNDANGVDPVITWDAITRIEVEMSAGCGAIMELFGYRLQLAERLTVACTELQSMSSALLESTTFAPKGV